MELEWEKTRQAEELHLQNLSPIRVQRPLIPPGYDNQQRVDNLSVVGTPVTAREAGHTPVFNKFYQPNMDRQLWQGYFKTYEQHRIRTHAFAFYTRLANQ